ncbi:MAG: FCD domain-containing protein [Pseudomonadales bacterium]|nr:FCD domain-containing protein [Pseudomonadales bacterium]
MGAKELSQRAATRVARNIVSEIQEKSLRPGSKLEPEHVMVEKQGAARGTVREALRFLEFQGALRIKAGPGGGPVVAAPGLDHLTSALSLQLQFANATFRSVLDARKSIYPTLAAEAAQNAGDQDIARLRESLARLQELASNTTLATAEARNFNELVASASNNLVLSFLVSALHRMSEHSSVEYSANHWRAYLKHSTKMVEAIEAGEADTARTISTTTHEAGIQYWEKNFPELLSEPIAWVTDDQNVISTD